MQAIAIVGDVHGHQSRMISMLSGIEQKTGYSISAVLQVGDFEAHRHQSDLETMAAPQKYRKLGDFPLFYQGDQVFPWPLYFIGGNHEPYGWYDQHLNGAPFIDNCYYLGRVGCIEVNDQRIVGLSGIYHPEKFTVSRPPVHDIRDRSNKDYVYYTEADIERALDYGHCDILLLHDWPKGIISREDMPRLQGKRRSSKPEEIGNEYTWMLIEALQPKVVACGHMHYQYRNQLTLNSQIVEICCVANVESGRDSIILLDDKTLAVIG